MRTEALSVNEQRPRARVGIMDSHDWFGAKTGIERIKDMFDPQGITSFSRGFDYRVRGDVIRLRAYQRLGTRAWHMVIERAGHQDLHSEATGVLIQQRGKKRTLSFVNALTEDASFFTGVVITQDAGKVSIHELYREFDRNNLSSENQLLLKAAEKAQKLRAKLQLQY